MLNRFCGLQLKQAADEVREHWDGWLQLVTRAERWAGQHPGDDPRLFVAVAWLSFEEGQSQRRYRVLLGEHQKIAEALGGEAVYSCNFVSIVLVRCAPTPNALASRCRSD